MKVLTDEKTKTLDEKFNLFLKKNDFSIEQFNDLVNEIVKNEAGLTREGVIKLSNLLTIFLEEKFSIKIPYIYGGYHHLMGNLRYLFVEATNRENLVGINPNWGYNFTLEEQEKYTDQWNIKYPYYGIDCTGFIILLFTLFGVEKFNTSASTMRDGFINNGEFITPMGKVYVLNQETYDKLPNYKFFKDNYEIYNKKIHNIKPGDLLHKPGHIVLITNFDKENGIINTTEARCYHGLIRSEYKLIELIEEGNFSFINLDSFYENPEKFLKSHKI